MRKSVLETISALSGIFGTYLAWSQQVKRRIDETVGYDQIANRRAVLAFQAAFARAAKGTTLLPRLLSD